MDQTDTLDLWARCEVARAAAVTSGAKEDAAHAAAKAVWDVWAQPLLAEQAAMAQAGTWQVTKDLLGRDVPDDSDPTTGDWLRRAACNFLGHVFEDSAAFRGFDFPGEVRFGPAADAPADPDTRTFKKDARFDRAQFHQRAWFDGAQFHKDALFGRAQFHQVAWFGNAQFHQVARFDRAQFHQVAGFDRAQFHKDAGFDQANFDGNTSFTGADFYGSATFAAIRAERSFSLAGTTFHRLPDFVQAHFAEAPDLDATRVRPARVEIGGFCRSLAARNLHAVNGDVSSRFRALKRLAIQAHDIDHEHEYAAGELTGRRGVLDHPWPRPGGFKDVLRRTETRRVARRIEAGEGAKTTSPAAEPAMEDKDVRVWAWSKPVGRRHPPRPVLDGALRFWLGALYGFVADFGRSIVRPVIGWSVLTTLFGWLYLAEHIDRHDAAVAQAKAAMAQIDSRCKAARAPAAACDDPPTEIDALAKQAHYGVGAAEWRWRALDGWLLRTAWSAWDAVQYRLWWGAERLSVLLRLQFRTPALPPPQGLAPWPAEPPPPPLHCLAGKREPWADAFFLSAKKGLLFLGLDQSEVLNQMHACLFGVDANIEAGRVGGEVVPVIPVRIGVLSLVQTVLSAALIFLFLMAVRNMFKIR